MMSSLLPVPEDRAGAIITLVDLDHERRGYAGRSGYVRGHEIQAGSVGLATTTRIHMNPPMQIRLSSICTSARSNVQTADRWGLLLQ